MFQDQSTSKLSKKDKSSKAEKFMEKDESIQNIQTLNHTFKSNESSKKGLLSRTNTKSIDKKMLRKQDTKEVSETITNFDLNQRSVEQMMSVSKSSMKKEGDRSKANTHAVGFN